MSSKKEIRMAENYEITERISIGDRDVVFGMDMDNELPYFCSFLVDNGIYYFFPDAKAGCDYAEMMELFADRIKEQCRKVREEQEKVTIKREVFTSGMCVPAGDSDLMGKVVAVRPEVLKPEYRSCEHQLIYITGGNGARAETLGTACFGTNLYSGKSGRWERYEILGEVKPECLPDWAKAKVKEIRRENIEEQIREKRRAVRKDEGR